MGSNRYSTILPWPSGSIRILQVSRYRRTVREALQKLDELCEALDVEPLLKFEILEGGGEKS